ncbi:MAG: VanW family protein [Bacteroides sp.]|nr:VanW family protein [Bacteroides sp.]MCM1548917.1 VanW family protein [Clostridium sp.]
MKEKSKKRLYGFLGVSALMLTAVFLHSDKIKAEEQEQICEGIFLDSIDISGMTVEEARKEYESYLKELQGITVQFRLEEADCEVDMSDLNLKAELDAVMEEAYAYGRRGNILKRYKEITAISQENMVLSVPLSLNEDYLVEVLDEELSDYIVPAKDAAITFEDGELNVMEGENGKELNAEETVDKLFEAIASWSGEKKLTVAVATNDLEPEHTTRELEAVSDEIGTFETHYSAGDVSRNNNIMNAADKISGSVIYPGEEFDTMEHLVPFTTANGWSYAGAYLNGEVISDIGGGICQVSTTLYNAVLQAELEVIERYPHSMAVGYVQLAADAALNEGTKNFRFKNNTENPIYIYAYASGGTLHVSIYGKEYRDEARTIEYVNEVLAVIPAGDAIETVDESKPADYRAVTQTAHTGYRANLWKNVYEDGELVDTVLVNSSAYNASPERVTVGPAAPEAPAEPETPAEPANPAEPTTTDPAAPPEGGADSSVPVAAPAV